MFHGTASSEIYTCQKEINIIEDKNWDEFFGPSLLNLTKKTPDKRKWDYFYWCLSLLKFSRKTPDMWFSLSRTVSFFILNSTK